MDYESYYRLKYKTDTENGNSGSPIIDDDGFAIGVHTNGECTQSGGENIGTTFTRNDFWNATNLGELVWLDQKREDEQRIEGSIISHFRFGSFSDFTVLQNDPIPFQFDKNSIEIFRAQQNIISNPDEKYYRWNNYNDVTNHRSFNIDKTILNFTPNFKEISSGIKIQNSYEEVSGLAPDNDDVEFKDPWFIDYSDPSVNNQYRNRGIGAEFHRRSAPFTIDFDTEFEYGQSYKGLFLNQDLEFAVENYDLSQNYPNPFNPRTIIKYQIPEDGIVNLKIFDILGKEVITLINDYKSSGKYEVDFDASNLASGMYIYRIQVNGYVSSRKMMLLK